MQLKIGERVEIAKRSGIVKYVGKINISCDGMKDKADENEATVWVGIELTEPVGQNDGSLCGQRYFECKPLHGIFLRENELKVLSIEDEDKDEGARKTEEQLQVANAELQVKIEELELDLEIIQTEKDAVEVELQAKLEEIEKKILFKDEELEKQTTLTKSLQAEVTRLTIEKDQLKKQYDDILLQLEDYSESQTLIEYLTSKNLDLEEKLKQTKEEVRELEAIEEINRQLESSFVSFKEISRLDLISKENEIQDLKEKIETLQQLNMNFQETLDNLQNCTSSQETVKSLEELNEKIGSVVDKAKAWKDKLTILKEEFHSIDKVYFEQSLRLQSFYFPKEHLDTEQLLIKLWFICKLLCEKTKLFISRLPKISFVAAENALKQDSLLDNIISLPDVCHLTQNLRSIHLMSKYLLIDMEQASSKLDLSHFSKYLTPFEALNNKLENLCHDFNGLDSLETCYAYLDLKNDLTDKNKANYIIYSKLIEILYKIESKILAGSLDGDLGLLWQTIDDALSKLDKNCVLTTESCNFLENIVKGMYENILKLKNSDISDKQLYCNLFIDELKSAETEILNVVDSDLFENWIKQRADVSLKNYLLNEDNEKIIQSLECELHRCKDEIVQKTEQLDELKVTVDVVRSRLNQSVDHNNKLESEIQDLKIHCKEIETLKNAIQILEAENATLSGKLSHPTDRPSTPPRPSQNCPGHAAVINTLREENIKLKIKKLDLFDQQKNLRDNGNDNTLLEYYGQLERYLSAKHQLNLNRLSVSLIDLSKPSLQYSDKIKLKQYKRQFQLFPCITTTPER